MAHYFFQSLKDYASYLLHHQLHEATIENVNQLKRATPPLLHTVGHLSEEELYALIQHGFRNWLEQFVHSTADEREGIPARKTALLQLPGMLQEQTDVVGISTFYSIHKQTLFTFLPEYTHDPQLLLTLVRETEQLCLQAEQQAFQQYYTVRQQRQSLVHEQLKDSYEEVQSMYEELHTVNEDLREQVNQRKATEEALKTLNEQLEERVRQRTAELQYQQDWLRSLFEQAPALIAILKGTESKVELFNKAFAQLCARKEVMHQPLRQLCPEPEASQYDALVQSVYRTGETVWLHEQQVMIDRYKDGTRHAAFLDFICAPYKNPTGETEGVILYGVEVTEQVTSRRKVEESQENLRMALEAGNMGTWYVNFKDGQARRSIQYARILGFEEVSAEWTGQYLLSFAVEEDRHFVRQQIVQAKSSGTLDFEARILRRDGQLRWVAVKGEVFYDQAQQPHYMAGVITDITEKKQAEKAFTIKNEELKLKSEALEKVNADLDNFVYLASHDLKSPIANLEGLVNLLNRKLLHLEGDTRKALDMVNTSVGRFSKTLHELTEISKFQKELVHGEEVVSFSDLLQEVSLEIGSLIRESGARVKHHFSVDTIAFDRKNLKSILYNLLSNAIKYRNAHHNCQIQLETARTGDYIMLQVRDNGMGIPQEQQHKIFDMFKKLHLHTDGSGLGLYIVKRIMDSNRGKIEIESQVTKGTTFRLYFNQKFQHLAALT